MSMRYRLNSIERKAGKGAEPLVIFLLTHLGKNSHSTYEAGKAVIICSPGDPSPVVHRGQEETEIEFKMRIEELAGVGSGV